MDYQLIESYFVLSNDMPRRNLKYEEFEKMNQSIVKNWFNKQPMKSLVCSICPGRTCNLSFSQTQRFLPCPEGENNIIEITDNDRYTYRFDWEKFYNILKSDINHPNEENISYGDLLIMGEHHEADKEWVICFLPSNLIQRSIFHCLNYLKENEKDYLMIVTEGVTSDISSIEDVVSTDGIFISPWNIQLKKSIERVSVQYKVKFQIENTFNQMESKKEETNITVSALKHAATHADGDGFEDEIYKVIRNIFHTVVPFGGKYKGVAIPDGLITHAGHTPFPIMFYDCKSFKSKDFKHKAEIPMQVNYYESFLQDFFSDSNYQNAGFVIFSSAFPKEVQKQITGSAQWKYVNQYCSIYFIGVDVLEKIKRILDLFKANVNFKSEDFFKICFEQKTHLIRTGKVKIYYESLFPQNAYTNFHFLKESQAEVALITAFLNYVSSLNQLEGLSLSLKEVIENAVHENLNKKVTKPTMSFFYQNFIDQIDELLEELHPLSILAILLKREEELRVYLGEKRFNEIKESSTKAIEALIANDEKEPLQSV